METNFIDILLVEDTRSDAEITIRVLKKNSSVRSVQHMSNGLDALDYLHKTGTFSGNLTATPRAILLDLKMPKIDGIECLKKIKESPLTQKIPVIIFTSSKEVADIEQSYLAGANSYIVKPVAYEEMIKTISAIGEYWVNFNQQHA